MSEINYAQMSDKELRKYFLEHKNEQSTLQAYLQRRNQQPKQVITKVGDPDFDLKIEQAIKSKKSYPINWRRVNINYSMVIYPCEEGGFVAEIPALKGCLAQGETLEDTLHELMIVRELWLETAQKSGKKLPDLEDAIAKVKTLS